MLDYGGGFWSASIMAGCPLLLSAQFFLVARWSA